MFVVANLLALCELLFLPNSVFLYHKFSELPLLVRLTPSVVIFLIYALLRGVSARYSKQGLNLAAH